MSSYTEKPFQSKWPDLVNPSWIHVREPSNIGFDPSLNFYLEISGSALWTWRKIPGCKTLLFEILQDNLRLIGFELETTAKLRLTNLLAVRMSRLVKSVESTEYWNLKQEHKNRWIEIELLPAEVKSCPSYTLPKVLEKKEEQEKKLEEVTASLYVCMAEAAHLRARCRLAEKDAAMAHHGKPYSELSAKEQRRKRALISDQAEAALWFAETFGLTPSRLMFKDSLGNDVDVALGKPADPKEPQPNEEISRADVESGELLDGGHDAEERREAASENKKARMFQALTEEDREKVETIAFIMDRFSISLEAYHELTKSSSGQYLPRSYLVEGCTKHLDAKVDIRRTPGDCAGAEVPFLDALKKEVKRYLELKASTSTAGQPDNPASEISLKVKIAGDGAQLSRTSSLFVFSFAILESTQCLSSCGTHTVAVIKAKEDYSVLRHSLGNVIREVNSLVKDGTINIDGKNVKIEMFLGGDYKFLLMAMGMKAANSANSCIWCKGSSKERCDLCLSREYFNSQQMTRVLSSNWVNSPGCRSEPLFQIPVDRVVFDELHMFLRIMDRLESGIINEMVDWDERSAFTNGNSNATHLDSLVQAIKSCGVSFAVWRKEGKLEWTSLMGNDKKRLLRQLPDRFPELLKPESLQQVTKLWKDFRKVFEVFTCENPTEAQKRDFQPMAHQWAKHLVSMKGLAGYTQTNQITPYIHILVYHVADVLDKYDSLKVFSGQGVEKKNDDFRRYFMRKINRWDACASMLKVEKRQEELSGKERVARGYRK